MLLAVIIAISFSVQNTESALTFSPNKTASPRYDNDNESGIAFICLSIKCKTLLELEDRVFHLVIVDIIVNLSS